MIIITSSNLCCSLRLLCMIYSRASYVCMFFAVASLTQLERRFSSRLKILLLLSTIKEWIWCPTLINKEESASKYIHVYACDNSRERTQWLSTVNHKKGVEYRGWFGQCGFIVSKSRAQSGVQTGVQTGASQNNGRPPKIKGGLPK